MTDPKALAKRPKNELRELIEGSEFRAQLAKALPNAMSPERFVRITVTSTMRNPKLLLCSRETFFRCLLDLSAMGLEPDGRQAHLIPRKNKAGGMDCTLVVDFKGLKELLYRNGDIVSEHSDVVGDLDLFEYEFGSNQHLTHRPNTRDRGKVYCAYSYVTLPKGGSAFEVMSVEEIEGIRRRSPAGDSGPWVTDWSEMAKKTVFRRLSKSLPLSPKTRDAIEVDQTYDAIEPAPIATTRAVVGGRSREPEPEISEDDKWPPVVDYVGLVDEHGPVEEPEPPAPVHQTPQEPVSAEKAPDKPPGPLQRVRLALKEAGFKAEELLNLLKTVRLAKSDVKDLGNVPANALEQALEDWQNVIDRLTLERSKAPVQEDFPV